MLQWFLCGLVVILIGFFLLALDAAGIVRFRSLLRIAAVVLPVGGLGAGLFWGQAELQKLRSNEAADAVPPRVEEQGYIGSDSCRACHAGEYESWHATFHRTMTQVASPESVKAPFDGRRLSRYGGTARVERRGEEFWVEMDDPQFLLAVILNGFRLSGAQPQRVERQIVMTTGSHHFQVYWYRSGASDELWQFPWRYSIDDGVWIHRDDCFLAPPETEEMRGHRVWNGSCIECHAVGGQPGQAAPGQPFRDTKVADLGIACEACHGPGAEHVAENQNPIHRYREHFSKRHDPSIVNPAACNARTSVEACGTCHVLFDPEDKALIARRWKTGRMLLPGTDWTALGRFATLADEATYHDRDMSIAVSRFWADGNCRSGGRELNGVIDSRCFTQGGLTCLHCHSMHNADPNDQLAAGKNTNEACYQCHRKYRKSLTAHTHHAADSTGSLCYNCHMPHTSYALLGGIRSHRIDVPVVTPLATNSRLNACNHCHLDRTLDWTNRALADWYGTPEVEIGRQERAVPASVLWALKGDAGQRVISAWHMGWKPARDVSRDDWMVPALTALFEDEYAAVRYNAFRSLSRRPAYKDFPNQFDADAETRAAAGDQVRQIWKGRPRDAAAGQNGDVGEPQRGRSLWDETHELHQQRDQRRMLILE